MEQNVLGKNIAALRKSKGMTQEALANQLGVTFQAVSKWENGQSCPDITMLPELSDLLGVSIDELFGRALPVPAAAQETAAETEQASGGQVVYHDLPWEDDRSTLHVVLFAGHRLIGNSLFSRHQREKQKVEFCWEGPAINIQSDFSVNCAEGTVIQGSVTAGDGVNCGAVCGSVTAGDGVNCGAVGGNVRAGDGVRCEVVGGNVQAGDSVHCGNVGGSVRAGDGVTCGDVYGDVHASDSVHCQVIHGNASSDGGARVRSGRHQSYTVHVNDPAIREDVERITLAAKQIARDALDLRDGLHGGKQPRDGEENAE
ncbi:MAG: helix-turn-helix transcriptional regulator [Oscillospiraceae bacterium]|nr:helix-turn-helix transcriptional regulator [Oscillospiraceae bacterium]